MSPRSDRSVPIVEGCHHGSLNGCRTGRLGGHLSWPRSRPGRQRAGSGGQRSRCSSRRDVSRHRSCSTHGTRHHRTGAGVRPCRFDGGCPAQPLPPPDMAHLWRCNRLDVGVDDSAQPPPGPVQSCVPAGSDRHPIVAVPTAQPTIRTGREGYRQAVDGQTRSERGPLQESGSGNDAEPSIGRAPTPRRCPRLHDGQPIYVPTETCDPTPPRSVPGSHPPTDAAPLVDANLVPT